MNRIFIMLAIVFATISCSFKSEVKAEDASTNPVSVNTPAPAEIRSQTSVTVIGNFSNVKSDGEHEWGYSVNLWRKGDDIIGLLSGADVTRLIGDPPTGLLERVSFEPATKRLSFTTKLSVGIRDDGTWSRDLVEFDGTLTKKVLEGTMRISDDTCGISCSKTRKVKLKLNEDLTQSMSKFDDYEEFKARADEILKRLGPKW